MIMGGSEIPVFLSKFIRAFKYNLRGTIIFVDYLIKSTNIWIPASGHRTFFLKKGSLAEKKAFL